MYLRHGKEALRELYPPMTRTRSHFSAGEAVNGDGLKLDRLWIDWGDEILKTSTVWVWSDLRTNKILAHRVGKTENTDLFRLATYDLTAICAPRYAWLDNTRVAANKAMTGRAPGRRRFKDRPGDPAGVLLQLGIEPRFTDPDRSVSSPGAKPVERSFGIGGLHSEIASHPRFIERGYSKETAIPVAELMAVVAEEVVRFNARPKRRTEACRGILSFDEAFSESFRSAPVRRLTERQRRILLLMPEVVRASRARGDFALRAGTGRLGSHRYWHERLVDFRGQELVAYFDPERIGDRVAVYTLDGRFLVEAQRTARGTFDDTVTGREYLKEKRRWLNAQRKAAAAEVRMTDLERASDYPVAEAAEIHASKIVRGHFGTHTIGSGDERSSPKAAPSEAESARDEAFRSGVAALWARRKSDLI